MDVYTRLTEQAAVLLGLRRFVLFLFALSVLTNTVLAFWILTRTDQSRTVILSPGAQETYIATDSSVSPNLLERFAVQSLNLVLNGLLSDRCLFKGGRTRNLRFSFDGLAPCREGLGTQPSLNGLLSERHLGRCSSASRLRSG